ncbi:MAG: LysR family transcriptional regulator [Selenomonas sp.]|uniref:LysR family transcriptional regulator n=1 Tax=Selenomonas sp. TaxID=2053611 RepID=UPI0025CF3BF3|nr:LysR family transcriptional regulator [Selenomonas sp.]MCI6100291.1 LysR family transcriptional regulator [Selenomonas sp.]MCI6230996.1 LysR family transcriptional regulator [Selenomonas sp.]
MFELHQLQQLITVAETGTLSAAAETLHISQPALSRSMQKLEEHFEAPLFSRTKNHMALNETGVCAVQYARRVIEAATAFDDAVHEKIRSLTRIAVGAAAPAPLWLLMPQISREAPGMMLSSVISENETSLENGLKNGTYRLILISHPIDDAHILCKPFTVEQLSVSLPADHPLASRKGILAKDLAGLTMLLFSNLGVWTHFHERMTDTHFILQTDRQAFSDLVTASVLPNFVTNLSMNRQNPQEGRVTIPLLDADAKKTFYLCARKNDRQLFQHIKPHI